MIASPQLRRLTLIILFASIAGITVTSVFMQNVLNEISDWQIAHTASFYKSPVLAFEFARDALDVERIFRTNTAQKIDILRRHTRLDFWFILSYVALIISLSRLLFSPERWLFMILTAAAILTGLLDVLENTLLLGILDAAGDPIALDMLTSLLQPTVWSKWVLAGAVTLVLAGFLLVNLGGGVIRLLGSRRD